MDIVQSIRELQELYPSIPISWFMQIVRRIGLENTDRLRAELAEAERQTLRWLERRQKRELRKADAAMRQLRHTELHRGLRLDMSLPVPHAHVQLVLVYGFARVGSQRIFAGGHALKADSVLRNVGTKLEQLKVTSVSRVALKEALDFLVSQGAVISHPGKQGAISLNLDENAAGVSSIGRAIVIKVKKFFHIRHRG